MCRPPTCLPLLAPLVLAAAGCAGLSPAREAPPDSLEDVVRTLAAKVTDRARGRVGIVPFVERRSGERTLAADYVADVFYPELEGREDVVLVDRGFALDAAFEELCRSHSLRVDKATAIDIGRQVAAQAVLTGMLTDLRGRGQRLDVRLLEVATGRVLGSAVDFLPPDSVPDDLIGRRPPDFESVCGVKGAPKRPEGTAKAKPAPRPRSPPRPRAVAKTPVEKRLTQLTVGIRRWGGYAGGVYFNGGLEPSARSRFRDLGLDVRFRLQENIPESVRAWRSGEVDVMWITVDDLPTEYRDIEDERPSLFLQAAWSRGEEVVVARSNIVTLNDLKGKTIALEKHTTAHSFLLVSLDLAALGYGDVRVVEAESSRDAADLFIRGEVDAAVVWIDDDERCLREVRGAHRLESTADASFLIAESLMVRGAVVREKREAVERLAEGWLRANAEINGDARARRRARDIMVKEFRMSRHVAESELALVRLATLGDNQNFFGLNPDYRGETGEHLYEYFASKYRSVESRLGRLPLWSDVAVPIVVQRLGSKLRGWEHRAESLPDFRHCGDRDELPLSKKGLSVRFGTDEYHLTPDDEHVIDERFAHLAEIYFNDCIRIDGNTDDRGPFDYNVRLSKKRAESVARYLQERYGFDPQRILVVGNGPSQPVDTNATEGGRSRNRRTDFELLHKRE
ncbi:MAG: OmpA family protein [Myxococcota bacterium]